MTLTMKNPKISNSSHPLPLIISLCSLLVFNVVFYISNLSAQPVSDPNLMEQLEEKDLLIRNLRRTIFDLEAQVSGRSDKSHLQENIRLLKQELKSQRESLQQEYSAKIDDLQNNISQLRRQIQSLEKEKQTIITSQNLALQEKIDASERLLNERTEQLNKANELVAKIVADKTETQEKLSATTIEPKEKSDTLQELDEKYKEIKTKQDQNISKAQKPLTERISELEKNIKDIREQALSNEEKLESEKDILKKKHEGEIKDLTQKLKVTEDQLNQNEKNMTMLNAKLKSVSLDAERKLADLNKTIKEKEEKLTGIQKKLNAHDSEISALMKKYEGDLEVLSAQIKEKDNSLASAQGDLQKSKEETNLLKDQLRANEETIATLTKENKDAAGPYLEKISGLEKQMNDKDLTLKLKDDELVQFRAKLIDQEEKTTVYKKLVDNQDVELTQLRKGLEDRQDNLSKLIEKEKVPLQEKIAQLEGQIADFDKKLSEERFNAKIEIKSQLDQTSTELSAAKVDVEYKLAQIDKMAKEKSLVDEELRVLLEKNAQLNQTVEELSRYKNENSSSLAEHADLKTKNAELNERLEILLHENAEHQKKMAEISAQLQAAADSKLLAAELAKAENLINGFKKDVDAKTVEISSLSDENHDLRMRLKQNIKDMETLNQQMTQLKQQSENGLSKVQSDELKEQSDTLKTALSKARQLIAQREVELEDLKKDRDLLRNDIVSLTDQLNLKIQQIGELDHAKRNSGKLYTEQDLTDIKTPLLTEISNLKNRITELEQQLVENWNRAESMLLELKNHPTIRQAENQKMIDELVPVR